MTEFFFATPAAQILNPVIWGITLWALADVAWAMVTVRRMAADVNAMRGVPAESGQLTQRLEDRGLKERMVGQRILALSELKKKSHAIDTEILAALSSEELRSAAPVARWATSVLVLVGLAGTLVGLGIAVSGVVDGLPGSEVGSPSLDTRAIVQAIKEALAGMQVAFSTTLSGVFGAVLVGSGLAALRSDQSKQIRTMEELSATNWVPAFDTSEESRFSEAVRALSGVRSEFEALRNATLEILGKRGKDAPSLAEYVETVRSTTTELQAAVHDTRELLPEIQRALQVTIQNEQQALRNALAHHTSTIEPLLQSQQRAADALTEAVSGELDRIAQIKDVLERLTTSFEGARGTWEQADHAIERMGTRTAEALRDGFRDSLSAVARLTEAQAQSQRRVTEALDAFQSTNRQTMATLAEASNRALNHSEEVVSEIRGTLRESLQQVGDRLIESQRGSSGQIATGLSALGREIRDSARPVTAPLGSRGAGTQHTAGAPAPAIPPPGDAPERDTAVHEAEPPADRQGLDRVLGDLDAAE